MYSRASASAAAPSEVTRPLKPLLARRVEQEPGEGQVVLDDQQHPVAGLDVVAVVADLVDEPRLARCGRLAALRPAGAGALGRRAVRRRGARLGGSPRGVRDAARGA